MSSRVCCSLGRSCPTRGIPRWELWRTQAHGNQERKEQPAKAGKKSKAEYETRQKTRKGASSKQSMASNSWWNTLSERVSEMSPAGPQLGLKCLGLKSRLSPVPSTRSPGFFFLSFMPHRADREEWRSMGEVFGFHFLHKLILLKSNNYIN